MKTPQAVRALAALAQGTRLSIYRLLVQQGPGGLSAGTIAERLDIAGATLSFHLKELAHAGMVAARQDGRYVYYSANYGQMNGAPRLSDRELLPRSGLRGGVRAVTANQAQARLALHRFVPLLANVCSMRLAQTRFR
jgi:DNA-binding transcriptional ArsR family regulator